MDNVHCTPYNMGCFFCQNKIVHWGVPGYPLALKQTFRHESELKVVGVGVNIYSIIRVSSEQEEQTEEAGDPRGEHTAERSY